MQATRGSRTSGQSYISSLVSVESEQMSVCRILFPVLDRLPARHRVPASTILFLGLLDIGGSFLSVATAFAEGSSIGRANFGTWVSFAGESTSVPLALILILFSSFS